MAFTYTFDPDDYPTGPLPSFIDEDENIDDFFTANIISDPGFFDGKKCIECTFDNNSVEGRLEFLNMPAFGDGAFNAELVFAYANGSNNQPNINFSRTVGCGVSARLDMFSGPQFELGGCASGTEALVTTFDTRYRLLLEADPVAGTVRARVYNDSTDALVQDIGPVSTGSLGTPDKFTIGVTGDSGGTLYYGALTVNASGRPISNVQDERNRIRSSVSEDAGSLLDSVSLNAVDVSFNEAFLLGVSLSSTTPKNFVEALDVGATAQRVYPLPRQTTEFINDYAGETILSRMARTYPSAEMAKVEDAFSASLTTFTVDGTTYASPQEVLTGFFAKWAAAYPWFGYETVPDLRLKVLGSTGIMTPAEYGYTVSKGQPNPEGVINRCTVTSQPYVWTEDGGAYTQSWFQLSAFGFPSAEWYTTGTGQDLSATDAYPTGWTPSDWQLQSNTFLDTSAGVKLTDSLGAKQVGIDWKRSSDLSTVDATGSVSSGDITLTDLDPDSDAWQTIVSATFSTFLLEIDNVTVEIQGRYDDSTGNVQLRPGPGMKLETNCALTANCVNYVVRVNLLDASDVWQADTKTESGTFGFDTTEDWLQAPDGATSGNAVINSQTAYGVRDATIDVTGYGLTEGTVLKRVAEAYVLDAMNPTLVRTVEQSVWRAFPVKFSDMGKIVALPGGEEGRVISRSYVDDFGSNFGDGTIASSIKVEVIDQDGDGYIDVDTNFLRLDNGDLFQLDNDEIAEVN